MIECAECWTPHIKAVWLVEYNYGGRRNAMSYVCNTCATTLHERIGLISKVAIGDDGVKIYG